MGDQDDRMEWIRREGGWTSLRGHTLPAYSLRNGCVHVERREGHLSGILGGRGAPLS